MSTLELDPVGDHVDLGPGPHDGRGHRGVGAGVGLSGQADQGELVAEGVDAVGVEQRLGQLGREADPLDEPGPCLVQLGLGPVLVDPTDHLGRLDQGVVGPQGLAAVARRAPDGEDAPVDALLTDDHRQPGGAVGSAHREAPRLGDDVVGVDLVGGVLAQPLGPVGAECLLVGHGHVGEVPGGPETARCQVADAGGHGGGEVEHVDGPTSPHHAVDQLAAEGVVAPVVGVGRHHVGVARAASVTAPWGRSPGSSPPATSGPARARRSRCRRPEPSR